MVPQEGNLKMTLRIRLLRMCLLLVERFASHQITAWCQAALGERPA